MQLKKKTVNGKPIEYREELHHEVITKFGLWERIKILFSGKTITHSVIYTMNENIKVVTSEAKAVVIPWFILGRKKGLVSIDKELAEVIEQYKTGNVDHSKPPLSKQGKPGLL